MRIKVKTYVISSFFLFLEREESRQLSTWVELGLRWFVVMVCIIFLQISRPQWHNCVIIAWNVKWGIIIIYWKPTYCLLECMECGIMRGKYCNVDIVVIKSYYNCHVNPWMPFSLFVVFQNWKPRCHAINSTPMKRMEWVSSLTTWQEVSIAIYCLQQSKFVSAIHKTKKDSCCKRAISWRYQRMRSSLKRLLGICMSLLNLYNKSRWRLHKFLCNKITPSSKDKMCHCKRLKNQWGKDSI